MSRRGRGADVAFGHGADVAFGRGADIAFGRGADVAAPMSMSASLSGSLSRAVSTFAGGVRAMSLSRAMSIPRCRAAHLRTCLGDPRCHTASFFAVRSRSPPTRVPSTALALSTPKLLGAEGRGLTPVAPRAQAPGRRATWNIVDSARWRGACASGAQGEPPTEAGAHSPDGADGGPDRADSPTLLVAERRPRRCGPSALLVAEAATKTRT
jgi:hypothetical protein